MAVSIFESFRDGWEGGQKIAEQRRRTLATQMAGKKFAAGDASGAQTDLVGAGMFDEANAMGDLGDRQRGERIRQSLRGAVTNLGATATRQQKLEAQRGVYEGEGEVAAANDIDTQLSQLDEDQRQRAGEMMAWGGSRMLGLIDREVPEAERRAAFLQELTGTPYDTPEMRQKIEAQADWSDAGLTAIAQNTLSVAERLGRRDEAEQRTYDRGRDTEADRDDERDFAEQRRQFNVTAATKRDGIRARADGGLSDEGLDYAAEQYLLSGTMPAGLSRSGGAAKVISRAAELAAERGLTADAARLNQQARQAGQVAYSALLKQRTLVGAFERTALANLELAADLSEGVDRTGVPVVNRWVLAGKRSIGGDPEVAAFHTALTSALNEYAKVLSGATGAAGITDSAREEAESLLSTANTPAQVRRIMQIMRTEMGNRMRGFAAEEEALRATIGGAPPSAHGGDHGASPPSPPAAPAAATRAGPPQNAVAYLRQNDTPQMRSAFDAKYGAGAAARVLGRGQPTARQRVTGGQPGGYDGR